MFCTQALPDYHLLRPNVVAIPIRLRKQRKLAPDGATGDLFHATAISDAGRPFANLSAAARQYLRTLGITDPDADTDTAALVWMHALAIGFSPEYLAENEAGILTDYPRVPLPATRDALESSAALGRRVAALLDTERPPPGPAADPLLSGLASVGVIARADGSGAGLNPDKGDLAVTAGWGVPTKKGVMPSTGVVRVRDFTPQERRALVEAWGEAALLRLGQRTCDVYLNAAACWHNIPTAVWEYRVGGYQILKKWLSYRESKVLGRDLTVVEAREVTSTARRIAALLLLGPALDANYASAKKSVYAWPQSCIG
jgi:hypothetical protein